MNKTMSRKDAIIESLTALDAAGHPDVRGWYCYAPGDVGLRWALAHRTYSTREVEAFIAGCS